jgi:hypothetical protein
VGTVPKVCCGTRVVTGPGLLFETPDARILVDCGMFRGLKMLDCKPLPFEPGSIDTVLPTPAHIDHSGLILRACRRAELGGRRHGARTRSRHCIQAIGPRGCRYHALAAVALLLAIDACAPAPPHPASEAAGHPVPAPTTARGTAMPAHSLPGAFLRAVDVEAALSRLRVTFAAEVPASIATSSDRDAARTVQARGALAAAGTVIGAPQLLLLVDRNPSIQEASIVLARPEAAWAVVGGTRVSTGQAGRRGYYLTPLGVFAHTDAILDWRAEGTFNANGIRGLGLRGMRVWDFGWQEATKGWRADGERGPIRLLLHATDPDRLEQRLGQPASQGCVRIPAAMNRFLDRHGVLDADIESAARTDPRFAALLLPDREPTPLAGRLLVVVDSAAVP